MKKSNIVLALALSCLGVACTKENTHVVPEYEMEPMSFSTIETKTVLSESEKEVHWTENDAVTVYSNIGNYDTPYAFASSNIKGKEASFSGEVPVGTESFYAVYPKATSVNAESVTITIPSEQGAKVGSFAEELNFAIAKGEKEFGNPLATISTFENVCSYIKFTLPSYITSVKKVSISSKDALAGDYTVNFNDYSKSSITNGKNTISMSTNLEGANMFMFVIAPGEKNNIVITVEADGVTWTRSVASVTASVNKPLNFGVLDFKAAEIAKVDASHAKDANGYLIGTDITLNLGLPGSASALISNISVKDQNGVVVRGYEGIYATSADVTLAGPNDNPYLPQGTYTLEATYTVGNATSTVNKGFEVPAPTFDVVVSGETSYDRYLAGNISGANSANAETIYGVSAEVKISNEVLKQLEGALTYKLDNTEVPVSNSEIKDVSWGSYALTASYTFDSVTATASKTCHITGLPYRAPSKHKFNQSGYAWTKVSGDYTSVNDNSIDLSTFIGAPEAKSPNFLVPGNIKITVNSDYTRNYGGRYEYTYSVRLAGNEDSKIISHTSKEKKKITNLSGAGIFTTSSNYITCHYSYAASLNTVTVNSIEILYR